MNTIARQEETVANHKDAVACVAVLATAFIVVITGALNVYQQNELQREQAQRASQQA